MLSPSVGFFDTIHQINACFWATYRYNIIKHSFIFGSFPDREKVRSPDPSARKDIGRWHFHNPLKLLYLFMKEPVLAGFVIRPRLAHSRSPIQIVVETAGQTEIGKIEYAGFNGRF